MIKRELAIFLVVGATTVLLDFVSYQGLVEFEMMTVDIAKATGFLIGTLFAYFANRFWTFGHRQQVSNSAWRFVVLGFRTVIRCHLSAKHETWVTTIGKSGTRA